MTIYNTRLLALNYKEKNAMYKLSVQMKTIIDHDTLFLCIGTDKCIGDAFGPIVGHMLKRNTIITQKVFGTLEHPVHAGNIGDYIDRLQNCYPNKKILAIDASLGDRYSLGELEFRTGAIYPGSGLGKELPPVGDYALTGIIGSKSFYEIAGINNMRLNFIFEMAEIVANSIILSQCKSSHFAQIACTQ